jgi:hypothetical protein
MRLRSPLLVLPLLLMATLFVAIAEPSEPAGAAVASVDGNRWYTITVRHSGLKVDVRNGGTANGTPLQQYTANTTSSQQFRFVSAGGGYYRVVSRLKSSLVWDVSGGKTANGTKVQMWTWTSVSQQQWTPVSTGSGYVNFKPRHTTSKCLDVPLASKTAGKQLQIYSCNGTTAQQFKLTPGGLVYPVSGSCNAFSGAKQITRFLIASRYLPVCGPRPNYDSPYRTDAVRPYPGAPGYYPGYQCAELAARWLYHKYGAAETSGNGAQKVDVYAARYPSKFIKYANGTTGHAPAVGDVVSFSRSKTFNDIGHVGVVATSSVNSSGNGTVRLAEQNDKAQGYIDLTVRAWRAQFPGGYYPYIKWLHAR